MRDCEREGKAHKEHLRNSALTEQIVLIGNRGAAPDEGNRPCQANGADRASGKQPARLWSNQRHQTPHIADKRQIVRFLSHRYTLMAFESCVIVFQKRWCQVRHERNSEVKYGAGCFRGVCGTGFVWPLPPRSTQIRPKRVTNARNRTGTQSMQRPPCAERDGFPIKNSGQTSAGGTQGGRVCSRSRVPGRIAFPVGNTEHVPLRPSRAYNTGTRQRAFPFPVFAPGQTNL